MNPAERPTGPSNSGSWRWPAIVIGLLGLHIVILGATAVIASRDRGFVVVPDYYRKAQNWDKTQAQLRASEQLGWRVDLEAAPQVDLLGQRSLSIHLARADGSPIPQSAVEIGWFHHAHATEIERAKLTTDVNGRASQVVSMRYPGQYDFYIEACSGPFRYVTSFHRWVSNAPEEAR